MLTVFTYRPTKIQPTPEIALTSNYRSISGLELAGAAEFGALRRLRRRTAADAAAAGCLGHRTGMPAAPDAAAPASAAASGCLRSCKGPTAS